MSSAARIREREEQRRLSLRTLLIASVASATAALVTSQFWTGGTPIAAAVTPVIVALVSEMLHRPTEVIVRRMTSERTVLVPGPERPRTSAPPVPGPRKREEPPMRVYGRDRRTRRDRRMPRRRRIAVGVVATTAVLAFAIAAAALTVPELITGSSIGKGNRQTTLFGGHTSSNGAGSQQQTAPGSTSQQQAPQTTPRPQPTTTTPTSTETAPTQTPTTPKAPGK
jgi:hypothetical protein